MDKLRIGILGTGNIAHQFAAGVNHPETGAKQCTVTAAASRDGGKAEAFCERHGIQHALGGYDALINHPGVDAVYIALPNDLHLGWSVRAMEAGKDVLCEKPLALHEQDALEMFDCASDTGRVLVEAFMYRCHPQTIAVVDAVRSGAIGELKLIRSSFCFNVRSPQGNTRFNLSQGGGALMDIGCYCIDVAMLLAGRAPTAASATGVLHPSGVDVSCNGLLTFPGDVRSTFSCAMDTQASNLLQVCGTEGYIDVPIPWKPPSKGASWTVRGMAALKQDGAGTGNTPAAAHGPAETEHTCDAGQSLYALEVDAFAGVVLDAKTPFVTAEESVARMRVLDELRRQVGVVWG